MASFTAILSFLALAYTTLAAMVPINQGCATSSPSVKVLTYTQWTAPQIAPTSTVYDMIVTHYDYVRNLLSFKMKDLLIHVPGCLVQQWPCHGHQRSSETYLLRKCPTCPFTK
jgi:hypothetical protein